jgi:hypothetical protein
MSTQYIYIWVCVCVYVCSCVQFCGHTIYIVFRGCVTCCSEVSTTVTIKIVKLCSSESFRRFGGKYRLRYQLRRASQTRTSTRWIHPKCRAVSELHRVTTKGTVLFDKELNYQDLWRGRCVIELNIRCNPTRLYIFTQGYLRETNTLS